MGKAMLRPGGERATVKTEKNSQGKGKGTQRRGYRGYSLNPGPQLVGCDQTHTTLVTKPLSYIKSTQRIIYSYLSSWNNLQTLVRTRYWVLGTQVFLMILKQRKGDETEPIFASQGSFLWPQSADACLWGSVLCGLPSTGRYSLVPKRTKDGHFLPMNSIQFSNYSKRRSEGTGLTEGRFWETAVWLLRYM